MERGEDDYVRRLVNDGFQRGRAAPTMIYHPQTHVCVVVHGDEFAFAATELELRKMRSRMCEWYDVKVRGILGSANRYVREIEMLGSLRTQEGLEASDKHPQAPLEGLGLSKQSNTVNSAVRPEKIGQEEDANVLDGAERKKIRSLAAT